MSSSVGRFGAVVVVVDVEPDPAPPDDGGVEAPARPPICGTTAATTAPPTPSPSRRLARLRRDAAVAGGSVPAASAGAPSMSTRADPFQRTRPALLAGCEQSNSRSPGQTGPVSIRGRG